MKKQLVNLLIVIISFLGILDAGYVTYTEFTNQLPICRPPFQCAVVLESPWAYIAGLPLSFYGLIFYLTVFVLSIINFLEIKPVKKYLKALGVFGFLFSIYLVSIMAFIIQAWCLWCLISAISVTLLFIVTRFLPNQSLNPSSKKVSADSGDSTD